MKISIVYSNAELVSMEEMGTEINRQTKVNEKVEIFRERINSFSPYITASVTPMNDGSSVITMNIKTDYVLDICGTIKTHAKDIVNTGRRIYKAFEALKAISPCLGDLKTIMSKAMDFKTEGYKKAA